MKCCPWARSRPTTKLASTTPRVHVIVSVINVLVIKNENVLQYSLERYQSMHIYMYMWVSKMTKLLHLWLIDLTKFYNNYELE